MAKGLKDTGMQELSMLARRVRRQLSLERIGQADADFLMHHIALIEERIENMYEEKKGEFS